MADEITEKIIGAAIEVHRFLGPGLLESIYEDALCHEMDLLVSDEVVVEIKSVRVLSDVFVAQTLSYLKAAGLKRALLINFGARKLTDGVRRFSL